MVDSLGGLTGLEGEDLDAVVGAPPGVPESLAGGDAAGEPVEVAAAEGPDLLSERSPAMMVEKRFGSDKERLMPSHARRHG